MSTISTKQALVYGTKKLKKSSVPSARLDAEILLGFVLNIPREKMLSNPQSPITNYQLQKFKKLIFKRAKNWPIAYLIGSKEFYGLDFFVNKNVLVPRPETEVLVEEVLNFCRGDAMHRPRASQRLAPTILEIGTGSGCIALTLAKYLPKAKIIATDISEKTLKIARKNHSIVEAHCNVSLRKIRFTQSNLLQNIKSKSDIIIANLPYLTSKELREKSIYREPRLALYGGKNGLGIYEKLFKEIKSRDRGALQCASTIFLEISETQGKKMEKLVKKYFPNSKLEIKKDLAGRDRVVIIKFQTIF